MQHDSRQNAAALRTSSNVSHELAAHCMWRNQQAARAAIARGDFILATHCLRMIRHVQETSTMPSLKRACVSAAKSLAAAVSIPNAEPPQPNGTEPESAA